MFVVSIYLPVLVSSIIRLRWCRYGDVQLVLASISYKRTRSDVCTFRFLIMIVLFCGIFNSQSFMQTADLETLEKPGRTRRAYVLKYHLEYQEKVVVFNDIRL